MNVKRKNRLHAISLDFGGTLAYEAKEDHTVYYEVLGELGHEVHVEQLKEAYIKARDRRSREKAGAGRVWSEETFIEFIQQMLSLLMLPNPREVAIHVYKLWPYKMTFKAYEDAEPALKELKRKGYRLIIISNVSSHRNLLAYLSQTGLETYFDLLVASGSVGYEKPNPKIFTLASGMLNISTDLIMHVGDDYEADYLGAESAGLIGVLLDRRGLHKDGQCRKILKLTELPNLIDGLYS